MHVLTKARHYARMAVRNDVPVGDRKRNADALITQVILRNTDWVHRRTVEERQRVRLSQGHADYTPDELCVEIQSIEAHSVLAKQTAGLRFIGSTSSEIDAMSAESQATGTVHAISSGSHSASEAGSKLDELEAKYAQIDAVIQTPAVLAAIQYARAQQSPRANHRSLGNDRKSRPEKKKPSSGFSSRSSSQASSKSRSGSRGRFFANKDRTMLVDLKHNKTYCSTSAGRNAAISQSEANFPADKVKHYNARYPFDITKLGLQSLPCCFKCGDPGHYMNEVQVCKYGRFDATAHKCANCGIGAHLAANCLGQKALTHSKN